MASLSVPVRTVVPSIHPSSSTAVARARLGLHYGCCHYFRQPPFRLLVHAHAGHPRGDPCGRPRYRARRARRRPCRFPMASFGSVRDATRAWDATSHEGNEAVLDSGWATARVAGWATARVAPTRASSPSCSGVGATLVVAHAIAPAGRAVAHAVSRRPRSGRHGTPQGRGTPPRTKETKPCWIRDGRPRGPRDGRPRGSPLRGPRRRVVRGQGRPLSSPTLSRPQGSPSPMPVSRRPRSGRYGTPQGRGTPPRTKETRPCWIREGRPRGSRDGRPRGSRDGRPRGSPLRGARRRVVRG